MKKPAAFISYARRDDRAYGRRITGIRERLQGLVGAAMGGDFEIFQDCEGIAWGQHWRTRLNEALGEALFLIPILTPSYFNSEACRAELETFLELERRSGRKDRILSLYFLHAPVYEQKTDPLAAILQERQHRDWRHLRIDPLGSAKVMRALDSLARELADAIHAREAATSGSARVPQAATQTPAPAPGRERAVERAEAVTRRRSDEPLRHEGDGELKRKAFQRLLRLKAEQEARQAKTKPKVNEAQRRPMAREKVATKQKRAPQQRDSHSEREPGAVFRDIDTLWCPEMVVVPPGEFMMGSTDAERQWALDQGAKREWVEREKPQHLVRITCPLAVGRFPVTFEEYDHFAPTTGRAPPKDEGWGRGRRPVIDVSWEDSKAYAEWLAAETGLAYRLLSEAEWEHACRAGTTTRYWWGDEITPEDAHYGRGETSEVGSYLANPFGLYDMHGNVWEWVEDRWHHSYEGAPVDGSAWTTGDNSRRVLRGGSWSRNQAGVRSASRTGKITGFRESKIGFRVARTLPA